MLKVRVVVLGILFSQAVFSQVYTPSKLRLSKNQSSEISRFTKIKTESIGPTIMSGRVTDLEVNPDNPNEMMVAYASGGVWYSNNNGQSFKPVFDKEHSITVGDIAMDWKTFTIWVGTGENNSSRSSYAGTGVYSSSDTGKTWKHLGLEESHHIGKVLIHPNNPNIVYIAALGHLYTTNDERGVYKTMDGGKSWSKVLFVNNKTGAIDLCFDPQNPEVVFAAFWERQRTAWHFSGAGEGSGIYKSDNGGVAWQKIYTDKNVGRIGLAPFVFQGTTGLYAIIDDQNTLQPRAKDTSKLQLDDIASIQNESVSEFLKISNTKLDDFLKENGFPENLDAVKLKELIQSGKHSIKDIIKYTGNANANLFNSKTKGAVIIKTPSVSSIDWKVINDSIQDLYYTYGYYFGQIRVNPVNANEIYILGVVLANSEDGGKTFKKLKDDNVHADHHALWINPKNSFHIINGNDGGLNISYDKGKNWAKCNSPAVGQFYAVAVDESEPYNVYGGLQDNGVWMGSRYYEAGNAWHQNGKYPYQFIMGGDGMQVAVDSKQNLVYTGYQFGNYYRLDIKNGKSTYITPKHEFGEMPYRFNWQSPILLSKHTANTIYLGANYLFRSFDQGQTWKKISPDLTSGSKTGAVPYGTLSTMDESSLEFGLLYTGSDDGNLFVSRDAGNNWTNISLPAYKGYWVSRIQASVHKASRVYASFNGYRQDIFTPLVFISEDYGKTWKPIANNLPLEPINVIKEDLRNPSILYVGTDNGLYVSMNRGGVWEKLGQLPRVAVHDLVIQSKANEMIVGTHGRSLYAINLSEINSLDSGKLTKSLFVYDLPKYKASKSWGNSDYYWSPAEQLEVFIPFYLSSSQNVEINITDSSGLLIYTERLSADKGVNYFNYKFTSNSNLEQSKYLRKGKDGLHYLNKGTYKLAIKGEANTEEKVMVLE